MGPDLPSLTIKYFITYLMLSLATDFSYFSENLTLKNFEVVGFVSKLDIKNA